MEGEKLSEIKKMVRDARAVIITAGAGMGVDSGLPDFRGKEGFWNAYPVARKLNLQFHELANPRWFREDPALAWAFYGHRLNLYRKINPHEGFRLLLEYAKTRDSGYFVFTSNVDGQFQKAGFPADRVEECHGSIHHFQCNGGCGGEIFPAPDRDIPIDESTFRAELPLPTCPVCGGNVRPNILMFGDYEWNGQRSEEQAERFQDLIDGFRMAKIKPVVLEIGAGLSVPTVRMTSERVARMTGGQLIRINPVDPDVPAGGIGLPVGGLEGIRMIL